MPLNAIAFLMTVGFKYHSQHYRLDYVSADEEQGHPNPFISYLLSSAIHADCNFVGQCSVRSNEENGSSPPEASAFFVI